MKKEVKVTFETITPLWTGDAWGECKEIRPSSLLGSLRFWFELICYFSGICNEDDFNPSLGRFEKEVNRKSLKEYINNNGKDISELLYHLYKDQEIPIPAIIFGTTNWRSLIEIENITPIEDYCFENRLNLPTKICINKLNYEIKENNDCPNKRNNSFSVFYFTHPYFYGKFEVVFKVEETILESIFYPLLNFMDHYGFWGGKWNIGYGRLKILKVEESGSEKKDWEEKFNLERFNKEKINLKDIVAEKELNKNSESFDFLKEFLEVNSFYCKTERNFQEKTSNLPKKIIFIKINQLEDDSGKDYFLNLIKDLLKNKIKMRNCLRHNCENLFKECFKKEGENKKFIPDKKLECNNEIITCKELKLWKDFRHSLLGEQREGSKILPFIWKESETYKGGFISIAGILKLYYGE